MKKTMMLSLMAALTFSACSGKQEKEKPLSQSNFDLSVAPGVDFYQYACGGWIANNPLKPEYSRYGSFDRLADLCEEQMHTLVTELSEKKQIDGSIAAKVSDLYNLGLDSVRLNAEGFERIAEPFGILAHFLGSVVRRAGALLQQRYRRILICGRLRRARDFLRNGRSFKPHVVLFDFIVRCRL